VYFVFKKAAFTETGIASVFVLRQAQDYAVTSRCGKKGWIPDNHASVLSGMTFIEGVT